MRMQLGPANTGSPIREKLSSAALALLLLEAPAVAHADSNATTQLDFTTLLYGEQNRAQVVEPLFHVTRLFPDGQSLSAQLGLDVITGASPTGALPSGEIQTSTTASGRVNTIGPGQIPLASFQDHRFGLDADWMKPLGRLVTSRIGGHFSHEKDYQSLGVNGNFTIDMMRRLTTLTIGGGFNHDSVFPVGGTPIGLSDGLIVTPDRNSKQVKNLVLGLSRIITRRWMLGVDGSFTFENGYLTEPYKVISLLDPLTGIPVGQLTDNRPSTRNRTSVLFSSVYHLTDDVVYVSYRHYWDDWSLRSNTYDVKYRHELSSTIYLEPHVRYYKQMPASFYTIGLVNDAPLPEFATADYRLGPLKSITVGASVGFHFPSTPGEWIVRGEYIRQTGDSHPADAIGAQSQFDLFPPLNVGTLVVDYALTF